MKKCEKLLFSIFFLFLVCSVLVFSADDKSLAGTTWRTGSGLKTAYLMFNDSNFTGKILLGKFCEGIYTLAPDGTSVICTFTWVKDGNPPVGSKSIMIFMDKNTLQDDEGNVWIRR